MARLGERAETTDHEGLDLSPPASSYLLKQPLLVCDSFLTSKQQEGKQALGEIIGGKCLRSISNYVS